jgi:DNA-binding LacI/PurR family transcriptional regulator
MTIRNVDIARMLNISPAAVSLALNNKPGVSEETRRKVLEIVKQQSRKIPNSQPLRNDQLLFIIHKTHGNVIRNTPFFLELMESMQLSANNLNYSVSSMNFTSEMKFPQDIQQHINSNVKGLLLLASEMREEDLKPYKKFKLPFVTIDCHFPDEKVNTVGIDNRGLVRELVKYVYDMGHREIGFLRSRVFTYNFVERFEAYCSAMSEYGLDINPEFIVDLHSTSDQAYLDMKYVLDTGKLKNLPTAFIGGNDFLVIGAIRALKEHGIKIPEDVSMVGFDDMPIVRMMEPSITSMRIQNKNFSLLAIKRIIEIIETKDQNYLRIDIGGELKIRNSVKRIN